MRRKVGQFARAKVVKDLSSSLSPVRCPLKLCVTVENWNLHPLNINKFILSQFSRWVFFPSSIPFFSSSESSSLWFSPFIHAAHISITVRCCCCCDRLSNEDSLTSFAIIDTTILQRLSNVIRQRHCARCIITNANFMQMIFFCCLSHTHSLGGAHTNTELTVQLRTTEMQSKRNHIHFHFEWIITPNRYSTSYSFIQCACNCWHRFAHFFPYSSAVVVDGGCGCETSHW